MSESVENVAFGDIVTLAGDCQAVSQAAENTKKSIAEAISMLTKFQETMEIRITRLEMRESSCNSELMELVTDIEHYSCESMAIRNQLDECKTSIATILSSIGELNAKLDSKLDNDTIIFDNIDHVRGQLRDFKELSATKNDIRNIEQVLSELSEEHQKMDTLLKQRLNANKTLEDQLNDIQRQLGAPSYRKLTSKQSTSSPAVLSSNHFKMVCISNPNIINSKFNTRVKSYNSCLAGAKFEVSSTYQVIGGPGVHAPYWNAIITTEPAIVDTITARGFIMYGNHRLRCYRFHHHLQEPPDCRKEESDSSGDEEASPHSITSNGSSSTSKHHGLAAKHKKVSLPRLDFTSLKQSSKILFTTKEEGLPDSPARTSPPT